MRNVPLPKLLPLVITLVAIVAAGCIDRPDAAPPASPTDDRGSAAAMPDEGPIPASRASRNIETH